MPAQALGQVPRQLYELLGRIVKLHASLRQLLSQLQEGNFVQCSLQSLLLVTAQPAQEVSSGKQGLAQLVWLIRPCLDSVFPYRFYVAEATDAALILPRSLPLLRLCCVLCLLAVFLTKP